MMGGPIGPSRRGQHGGGGGGGVGAVGGPGGPHGPHGQMVNTSMAGPLIPTSVAESMARGGQDQGPPPHHRPGPDRPQRPAPGGMELMGNPGMPAGPHPQGGQPPS